MQTQTPILNIKMVPAGVDLVLKALNKLPREQSDDLFREIADQANQQLQELQKQAQATQAPEAGQQPASDPSEHALGGTD